MFGPLVILYLFTGGVAAGSFLVVSAWSLVFHHFDRSLSTRLTRAFKSLKARVYSVSLILLVFALLCLIGDLDYPERALQLFLRPHLTIITFGAFVLVLEFIIGLLLTLSNVFDLSYISGRTRKVLEIACVVSSIAVMVYTGIFLSSNASVPFWNTWSLAALIFFSSLSGGISLVLLIDYFIQDQTLMLRAARPLQIVHLVCLLTESLLVIVFLYHALSRPAADASLSLLFEPTMFSTALIGVVGMGIVIPLLLETYALTKKECRTIPVSDVVCLLGGLCLRYVVIMTGVH